MDESEPSPRDRGKPPLHLWLAILFAFLFVLTAVVPDWFEALGLEGLDNGDGSAERVLLVAVGVLAILESALTVRSYRRRSARAIA